MTPPMQPQPGEPTIFHVTHWKAGSQWVKGVLADAQAHRIVPLKNDMSHVTADPIVEGGVYSPVYLMRQVFEKAVGSESDKRVFVIIRDLRDTLISWYFSLKISHPTGMGRVAEFRQNLNALDLEDGLKYLINGNLAGIAKIQKTWVSSNHLALRFEDMLADEKAIFKTIFERSPRGFEKTPPTSDPLILRYEDMLADEQAAFKRIFEYCEIDVSDSKRQASVHKNSFEQRSGGRKRGQENIASHYRKAIVGDWQNYFTPATKELFKEKFGQVLIDTGYEDTLNW